MARGLEIKAPPGLPITRAVNPIESAKSAGLRYVCDDARGIRREMGPLGFRYIGVDGKVIRKAAELKRKMKGEKCCYWCGKTFRDRAWRFFCW